MKGGLLSTGVKMRPNRSNLHRKSLMKKKRGRRQYSLLAVEAKGVRIPKRVPAARRRPPAAFAATMRGDDQSIRHRDAIHARGLEDISAALLSCSLSLSGKEKNLGSSSSSSSKHTRPYYLPGS